jgi:signal transduction histidine kinase
MVQQPPPEPSFPGAVAPHRGGGRDRGAPALRWYLIWLVVGVLLPVVVFAGAIVLRLAQQDQAAAERRLLREARNLAFTIDLELSNTTRALQVLAASEQLVEGDLEGFYQEARRVLATQPTWARVVLQAPDGLQLFHSDQPLGEPIPARRVSGSLNQTVATGLPSLGNLSWGEWAPGFTFPVRVPVLEQGDVRYVLTAVITSEALGELISQQLPVEGEWTRTIIDGNGVVVARTLNPQRFVGQLGKPSLLQRFAETTEAVFPGETLEGKPVVFAFSRIDNTSWKAAVNVPLPELQRPVRQALVLVVGSGLGLLLVSGTAAFVLSRRIARSITSAAQAAEALVNEGVPQIEPLSIKEIVTLGRSLEVAAHLLAQRERERVEQVKQAEAAREEAQQANRMKDEFLSVLSHELRTPLNPILGWSTLLRQGKLDAAKTAVALEAIERNAKLQTQLIEDLLDVTRIMQGKLKLTLVPVDLVPIVQAAVDTVQLSATTKAVTLQTFFEPNLKAVLADPIRLQQVIWNLLSNAVKFSEPQGQVMVSVTEVGAQAQIQVYDTGPGIDPEFLPHVFDYFRQADASTTRRFGGLGLGLAIVHDLVKLHGGTVTADSLGAGQGATFTVRLPLLDP